VFGGRSRLTLQVPQSASGLETSGHEEPDRIAAAGSSHVGAEHGRGARARSRRGGVDALHPCPWSNGYRCIVQSCYTFPLRSPRTPRGRLGKHQNTWGQGGRHWRLKVQTAPSNARSPSCRTTVSAV